TYADSYEYDESTKKYTLVNPQVCQYSTCYNDLIGKFVVSYSGNTSTTAVNSTDLSKIYYVSEETTNRTIYYKDISTTDFHEGIYATTDETGKTSYYYRGAVTNNYLKFADKWWRIIRINGDGTIRIIYDGDQYYANGTSRTNASINERGYTFSKAVVDVSYNAYVGFMYGSTSASATYAETHANTNKSNAMEQLERWYTTILADYASLIDTNAGFCGDRRSSTNSSATEPDGTGGTVKIETYYGAFLRVARNRAPSLTCNDNDLYTVKGASRGNKAMTYPIGLITADEVAMAGGVYKVNNMSYYLFNSSYYWTLSPYTVVGGGAFLIGVGGSGELVNYGASETYCLRPVINLKADVRITGSGTGADPYVVS
ncbi:MAG: hypothetical protein K2J20_00860, partial [Bacilli bacterium]|nr:hypothetical protein [Bacilli bacterium]